MSPLESAPGVPDGAQARGWRGDLRRRFPRAIARCDRVFDPLVTWAKQQLPDETFIRLQYREHLGSSPDLQNPRLLTEKLQWLKLHEVTPLHRECADKVRARERVARLIGEHLLIPHIATLAHPDALTRERLGGRSFAAKTNHDCGSVVFCHDPASWDWEQARSFLRKRYTREYWKCQRELAYRGIVKKVLVEELLPFSGGKPPEDYKLFCFGGRVELIQVVNDRFGEVARTMMSRDWSLLPLRRRGIPALAEAPQRPARLGEMIAIAERLSAPFRFCRIDLYEIDGHVFFGEYTFYPEGGYRPFEPIEWEYRLGAMVDIG